MLSLTILLCLFTKMKSWDSPHCPNHPIPLILHSVISFYSITWKKKFKGWISDHKMRWSLW
jgi:hypothetical protein